MIRRTIVRAAMPVAAQEPEVRAAIREAMTAALESAAPMDRALRVPFRTVIDTAVRP